MRVGIFLLDKLCSYKSQGIIDNRDRGEKKTSVIFFLPIKMSLIELQVVIFEGSFSGAKIIMIKKNHFYRLSVYIRRCPCRFCGKAQVEILSIDDNL